MCFKTAYVEMSYDIVLTMKRFPIYCTNFRAYACDPYVVFAAICESSFQPLDISIRR
jgi:hypothetical protein